MRRRGPLLVAVLSLSALVISAAASPAIEMSFHARDAEGTDYWTYGKTLYVYEGGGSTCYGGAPWCITTNTSNIKLDHAHFTENFTAQEREDVDRYAKHYWTIETSLGVPTTGFNCHAYALYLRDDIWLNGTEQVTALADDFEVVPGTECEPYEKDDVCAHGPSHSSLIEELLLPYGYGPDEAALFVRAKWGGAGKYVSYDSVQYGNPTQIHRPK